MAEQMRKITVHINVLFDDMAAESTDDALDAVKAALASMEDHCHYELIDALELIGANNVKISTVVF